MAGHSKWSKIKHKKAATDAKRGKLFSKMLREISVAAKIGGANPELNQRLRSAVQSAKSKNIPNDTIDRAIAKGAGGLDGVNYEEASYEAYGPNGVAIIIETLTDNKNRTVSELRYILSRNGGSMSERGSVSWLFDKRGQIVVEKSSVDEDELFMLAVDAGADDINSSETEFELFCELDNFDQVRSAIESISATISSAEITMVAQTTVKLEENQGKQMLRLMGALEDNDDVQKVYANFDIPDELLS